MSIQSPRRPVSVVRPALLVATLAVLLAACERSRVETLEREVAQLKEAFDKQQKEFDADREAVELLLDAGETVTLKPTDQTYDAIWHDLGAFAIALSEVTPTSSGSRVKLRLGNLASAPVNNIQAKVEWGQDPEESPAPYSERRSLGRVLPPGVWSEVTLDLDGVPPPQLGYIRISELTIGSVSLREPVAKPSG